MSKTRNLSDLLDANGDVKSTALDNVPASDVVNDTTPQLGGDLASNGNDILMADNDQIKLGTSFDFSIRHNGTHSYIQDAGTGDLILKSNGTDVKIIGDNDEDIAKFTWNDGVDLYFNNSKKFETTSSGATVTGTLTATAFSGDGSALTNVPAGVSNVNTVVFTSSGTYTPTSGTKFVTVYATGGGGGGGGMHVSDGSRNGNSGAGGGGGTAIRTYNATELGSTASITIGSGGSGGGYNSNGGTGGNTSFNPAGTGLTISGNGGGGGKHTDNGAGNVYGIPGVGGNTSNSQVGIMGEQGIARRSLYHIQSTIYQIGQTGGGTFFGGNVNIQYVSSGSTNGNNGSGVGVGGNGAVAKGGGYATRSGGSGNSGLVLIMEYA